jgi:hypothetical protein
VALVQIFSEHLCFLIWVISTLVLHMSVLLSSNTEERAYYLKDGGVISKGNLAGLRVRTFNVVKEETNFRMKQRIDINLSHSSDISQIRLATSEKQHIN